MRRRLMMPKKQEGEVDYSTYRGVYIEDVDGNLYTEAEWDGSKTANGVAVLTDECRFVMALVDAYDDGCMWSESVKELPGVTITEDLDEAIRDYDGEEQTTIILNVLGNSPDESAAPAAYYCRSYVFPDGQNGYLGAAGEWKAVKDNLNLVKNALSACGGNALNNYYWSSTLYDFVSVWAIDLKWDEIWELDKESDMEQVRAFGKLKFERV